MLSLYDAVIAQIFCGVSEIKALLLSNENNCCNDTVDIY